MSTVQPEEGHGKQAAREHRAASLAHWEEAASGWVARQATLRELSAPGLALDDRRGRSAARPARARAGRRARRDGLSRGRNGGARRRGDHQRSGRCDARRRTQARGRAEPDECRVPGAQRRMDRPAGGKRGRRVLPLGLHADGRPACRADRDAPRAATRRARRAGGVGRDRAQPVGAAAGRRAARARPDRAAARGRARARSRSATSSACATCWRAPASTRCGWSAWT